MSADEMLIEAVKEYPFLYNSSDSEYHDNRKKDKAWQEIAGHFDNMTAKMCKKRWFSLRDAFRKSYKIKQMLSDQAAKKRKLWRFENQMAFIIPHLSERENLNNLSSSVDQAENITYTFSDTSSLDSNTEFNFKTANCGPLIENVGIEMVDETDECPRIAIKQEVEMQSAAPSRTERTADHWQHNNRDRPPSAQAQRRDALATFFTAMEDTVRSFTPEIIIEAKGKIAAVVNELEMKNWQQQQQ